MVHIVSIRMDYVTIKAVHQAVAALSITGFFARGAGSVTKSPAGFFGS